MLQEALGVLASYVAWQDYPGAFEIGQAVWHNTYPEFVPSEMPGRDHLNADTYIKYQAKCSEYNARVDMWEANCLWVCEVAILFCDKEF